MGCLVNEVMVVPPRSNCSKHTFARAFLQLRQAFRVTESGTRRRFVEEILLPVSTSFSLRTWRGSDPVDSEVD